MPEINGVSLSPLRNEYSKELALLEQQAKNTQFKGRLLKVVQVGCGMLWLASSVSGLYSAFCGLATLSASDRILVPVHETSGYVAPFLLSTVYPDELIDERTMRYLDEATISSLIASTTLVCYKGLGTFTQKLQDKYLALTDAIEDKSIIEYEDITPYEGALELDNKHDACPISGIPVADIYT